LFRSRASKAATGHARSAEGRRSLPAQVDPTWQAGLPAQVDPTWQAGLPAQVDPTWQAGNLTVLVIANDVTAVHLRSEAI